MLENLAKTQAASEELIEKIDIKEPSTSLTGALRAAAKAFLEATGGV